MTVSTERRVPSSVGNPVPYRVIGEKFAAAVAEDNSGATVLPSGTDFHGTGYVIALPEYSKVLRTHSPVSQANLAASDYTLTDLFEAWVTTVANHVTGPQVRQRAFGIWRQGEHVFLDVVEVFPDDDLRAAIRAGQARDQVAIWDAGRKVEIPTGGTGLAVVSDDV